MAEINGTYSVNGNDSLYTSRRRPDTYFSSGKMGQGLGGPLPQNGEILNNSSTPIPSNPSTQILINLITQILSNPITQKRNSHYSGFYPVFTCFINMDGQKGKSSGGSKTTKTGKNTQPARPFTGMVIMWHCHLCAGGPWLRDTTPACMECSHPLCDTCSVFHEGIYAK
ncbi:hypothetical protein PT974_01360 [Cladobotryum mycophilum]|uniref:Uncharacterized protein n=1 Tax=Cladobotryum mycophilum TaxID=491253 RepID=A0ABR0T4S8_9HYPO